MINDFIGNLALTINISHSFNTIVINIYELHTPLESRVFLLILSVNPCVTSPHAYHSTLCIIFLGVWWVSNPLPSVPQTDALPIELHTPFVILFLWLIQYVLTQLKLIHWDIAILDLHSDNVQISQPIFVLAIPSPIQWVITILRLLCLI